MYIALVTVRDGLWLFGSIQKLVLNIHADNLDEASAMLDLLIDALSLPSTHILHAHIVESDRELDISQLGNHPTGY